MNLQTKLVFALMVSFLLSCGSEDSSVIAEVSQEASANDCKNNPIIGLWRNGGDSIEIKEDCTLKMTGLCNASYSFSPIGEKPHELTNLNIFNKEGEGSFCLPTTYCNFVWDLEDSVHIACKSHNTYWTYQRAEI